MFEMSWGGEPLQLLPQKAAWLPQRGVLLVADVHIGKAVSFRRLGVPVPRGTTRDTLDRLTALVDTLGARGLVFLGDLLHSRHVHAPGALDGLLRWRTRHAALAMTLVRGNHDDRAGDPPPAMGIEVVDEPLRLGGLALCHHPRPRIGAAVLAGHVHPGTWVGRGFDRLRLPCFHFRDGVGVLPAFGAFTGLHAVEPRAGDRIVAVAGERLFELPAAGL